MNNNIKILSLVALPLLLNGCVTGAVVTGAQAAKTIAEERTTGTRIDDNAIAISINNKFIQKDFEGMFGSVTTDIKEGRVLLTGKVKDPFTKKEAERLVWEIDGVKEVINEINVDDKGNIQTYMNDVWISNQLTARMLFTKDFKDVNYNNSVVNNVVYLMGIAQNEQERESAIEIARRTKGVKKVVSHIILKDDPRRGQWTRNSNNTSSTNQNSYQGGYQPQYEQNSDPVRN